MSFTHYVVALKKNYVISARFGHSSASSAFMVNNHSIYKKNFILLHVAFIRLFVWLACICSFCFNMVIKFNILCIYNFIHS